MSDDNDDKERKGDAPKTGTLIRGGAPLPLVKPTGQQRTLYRLFARLSTFPFFNRKYVESLKTAKEVFDAKSELGEAIGKHQEIRERLKDFGTVLERGREERSRQLYEEKERRRAAENTFKHEERMQDDKNELKIEEVKRQQKEQQIQRMEQEKRELLLAKELEELRKPPPEPPKKTTTRGRSPKQKLRESILKRYEKEIARIGAMEATAKLKGTLTKAAEAEKEEELEKIESMP
jgi:hypothetical protein